MIPFTSLLLRLFIVGLTVLAGTVMPAADVTAIYLDFEAPASATAVEAMKREAAKLVEPAGFPLEWRRLGESESKAARRLVVVRLTGSCSADGALPSLEKSGTTLGSTAVVDGNVLPYSRIECDAIRGFLWEIQRSRDHTQRDLEFGCALGRVLAHELYHALLRTSHHHRAGFAKALQTPRDLTTDASVLAGGPRIPFEPPK